MPHSIAKNIPDIGAENPAETPAAVPARNKWWRSRDVAWLLHMIRDRPAPISTDGPSGPDIL